MTSDTRIVVDRLSEQYGSLRAVDGLSFTVEPGRVTGFLGPNGAGKTSDAAGPGPSPTGSATIGGRPYADIGAAVLIACSVAFGLLGLRALKRRDIG